MSTTTSPNMNLPIPVVGSEPGPTYATDINSSLTIVDQHNHAAGNGVQVTPSGLNINSSLPMNGNVLQSTGSINFSAQSVTPANLSTYMGTTDFFVVDGNGNNIQVTQSGSVAGSSGTITGLPSGTASAAYAAGVFTFQSATSTGANIDGASYVLRNNVASSKGLTLNPPNAMGANYSLTLPSVPAQTNVMTLDTSGNMGSSTYNAIANSVTRASVTNTGTQGQFVYSTGSGVATINTSAMTLVPNLSVTLTTIGNPVVLLLVADPANPTQQSKFVVQASTTLQFAFYLASTSVGYGAMIATNSTGWPVSSCQTIVVSASAGVNTFSFYAFATGTATVSYASLMAYELR